MNHIKKIEIIEYYSRNITINYSMENITSKLIDNIKDVHIIARKRHDTFDRRNIKISNNLLDKNKRYQEVSVEYNTDYKKTNFENEIYWGIRIMVIDFKFPNSKLKPNNYTQNDFTTDKTIIKNYDDFLNLFFRKNKNWNYIDPNTHLHIDKNKIKAQFSPEAIFYENIFKWELFKNSEELKLELLEKTGESIIPIFQIYPLLPNSLVYDDYKSYEKYKLLIENLSTNYLNTLYSEIINISNILGEFKYFSFQGPYYTFEEDLEYILEDEHMIKDWLKYINDSGYYDSNFH